MEIISQKYSRFSVSVHVILELDDLTHYTSN